MSLFQKCFSLFSTPVSIHVCTQHQYKYCQGVDTQIRENSGMNLRLTGFLKCNLRWFGHKSLESKQSVWRINLYTAYRAQALAWGAFSVQNVHFL